MAVVVYNSVVFDWSAHMSAWDASHSLNGVLANWQHMTSLATMIVDCCHFIVQCTSSMCACVPYKNLHCTASKHYMPIEWGWNTLKWLTSNYCCLTMEDHRAVSPRTETPFYSMSEPIALSIPLYECDSTTLYTTASSCYTVHTTGSTYPIPMECA